MKARKILKDIYQSKGLDTATVADMLGIPYKTMYSRLNRDDRRLNIDDFVKMLDVAGYQILVVEKGKSGEYVLDEKE